MLFCPIPLPAHQHQSLNSRSPAEGFKVSLHEGSLITAGPLWPQVFLCSVSLIPHSSIFLDKDEPKEWRQVYCISRFWASKQCWQTPNFSMRRKTAILIICSIMISRTYRQWNTSGSTRPSQDTSEPEMKWTRRGLHRFGSDRAVLLTSWAHSNPAVPTGTWGRTVHQ